MKWTHPLCLFLFVVLAAACASPKVGYDYDRSAHFNDYRTYEWGPGTSQASGDPRIDNPLLDAHIRRAVVAELRSKGFTPPKQGEPDFYVAYHVGLKDIAPNVSSQYYSPGMAGKPFTHSVDSRSAGGAHATTPDGQPSLTGTLLVDIIDVPSNTLVWRGTAAGMVDPDLSSQERDERIRTIVHEMFTHFPPH